MGFVITIRKRNKQPAEFLCQSPTETAAISKADRVFNLLNLDTVLVAEVDPKSGIITIPYKRERRCKHPNVQFQLTNLGTKPICQDCGLDLSEVETSAVGADVQPSG